MTTVQIDYLENFSTEQERRARKSMDLLEVVVNSDESREAVLNAPYVKTEGKSNEQIYAMITTGESWKPEPDNIINLRLHLNPQSPHEMGHTNGQTDIYTGVETFEELSFSGYAGHVIHEYTHTLGFGHSVLWLPRRWRTVPYYTGNKTTEIAERMITSGVFKL